MPQNVATLPSRSCYHLFSGFRIQESQRLGPDLFLRRARTREVFNAGPLGQTGCAMQPKFEFPLLICCRLDSR